MIIVKTSTGDVFLDEKTYFYIEHVKSERMINGKRNGADLTLYNVESVRYINDAQATDYKDEGSELENMTTKADLLEADVNKYLADYEEVLSGPVKSRFEEINNLDEGLKIVAKDGSV